MDRETWIAKQRRGRLPLARPTFSGAPGDPAERLSTKASLAYEVPSQLTFAVRDEYARGCEVLGEWLAPGRGAIVPVHVSLAASRVEQGFGLPFPFRRPERDQPGRPFSERIVDGALGTTIEPPVCA